MDSKSQLFVTKVDQEVYVLPRVGLEGLFCAAGLLGEGRSRIPCENKWELWLFWFVFNLAPGWDARATAVPQVGAVTVVLVCARVPSPGWSRRSSQGLRYFS